jgi:hypothetical protein
MATMQFVQLWLAVQHIPLRADQDQFRWTRSPNGQYSASLAYNSYVLGSIEACYAKHLWESWAPLKEKVFMWLALKNWCWTGDRLRTRRLAGPYMCILCDQRLENANHLMMQCPTARAMWHQILAESGFEQFVPQADNKFRVWWCSLKSCRPAEGRKELSTRAIAYCRQI